MICAACGEEPYRDENGAPIALKRCSRCKVTYYHNIECQKRHYKIHRHECAKLERSQRKKLGENNSSKEHKRYLVRQIPGKGKGVLASEEIRVGDSITLDPKNVTPVVLPVLFSSYRRSRCCFCFRKTGERRDSSILWDHALGPHLVCSRVCQQAAREALADELAALRAVFGAPGGPPVLLPTALLVYRILSQDGAKVDDMVAHDSVRLSDDALIHEMAVLVTAKALLQPSSVRDADMVRLLQRIKFNSFTITERGEQIGFGLFCSPAYRFNHSCRPNAQQSFVLQEGSMPALQFRATRSVQRGEEVCIEYYASHEDLRHDLELNYNFSCKCEACA